VSQFNRDGDEIREEYSADSALPELSGSGAQSDSFSSESDFEYDLRSSAIPENDNDWGVSSINSRMRRDTDDGPVKYPEGSLGAFSTPEDYEAHTGNEPETREPEAEEDDVVYDDPILLFPPDELDEDLYRTVNSGKKHHRRFFSDESDIDDSVGISFSRYKAENKEGEFFFMPFLDIPDEPENDDDDKEEEEGEEISFSFRKVDADQVKKEKEFIFMPFLNVSDDSNDDDDDDDDDYHRRRSLKGTIFDEGLYLIPLESEEEEAEEEEEKHEDEDEEDSGIYVVGSEGGVIPTAPKVSRPPEKKTALKDIDSRPAGNKKKKRPAGSQKKKPPAKKGAQGSGGKLSATEEQFRAAMRNVSPEIRAAVKNDPIQRAALEQAVRIALVQQAAQEAVEKATGRPVFGGSSAPSGKKRRPPHPPQKPSSSTLGGGSRARNMSFSPFSLRSSYQEDGGISEFGVTEEPVKQPTATEFGGTAAAASAAPTTPAAEVQPDSNQDPVLAMLGADSKETSASDTAQQAARRAAYQSPAAVRAAMRTGLDVDAPGVGQVMTATGPKTTITAAERDLQVKRSGCLIWLIVAFVLFFIGLIGVLVLPNITKQNNFDKAIDLMDRGQYLQAIQMFEKFDSNDTKFYEDCRVNISECAYRQANQYFSEGKYYEAYNLLVSKAVINNETKPLALRSNYYYAEQLYAEGDWQNAANAYSYLLSSKYEDSQEKYNICQYQMAQEKVDQGDYLEAYQSFAALGSYSDSSIRAAEMIYEAWNADAGSVTMVQLTDAVNVLAQQGSAETLDILGKIYNKAGEYASAREYKMAYQSYRALGSYSQSAYNAALCMYNIWSDDLSFGTLSQREDAMIALRQRMGDDQAAEVLNSAGFNPVRLLGEWSDGDSTVSITRVNAASEEIKIVCDLVSHDGSRVQVETSAVGFDGNVVYYLTDPENVESKQGLFEVTRFDSLVALEPGGFTAFCFLNNSEYELTRQ